ncbi:MAG TPA: hypothetical protein VGG25_31195 [Streptosporangiaceae bacterium]|jgi:hypothetical protein
MTTPAGAAAPAAAPAKTGAAAAPVMAPWPFPVGVFDEEIQNSYDETVTMATGAKQFPDVQIEPDGWSRGWWFDFNIVVGSNEATVAFEEDFPFCAVDTVLLKGTNVPQTFGPFGGYDWMTVNKYGGYQPVGDPRNDQSYVGGTAGSGGTDGSAHFTLYLPLEITQADALGDLQNQSDNSVYRVAVTLAASGSVYSTAPTDLPTVELKVEQDSYSEPVAALALSGRPVMNAPPVPGTRQCWQQEDDSGIVASSHTTKISNGIGYAYRNVILKLLTTTRADGEADYPDPLEIWLGGTRLKYLGNSVWKTKTGRRFRLTNTTANSANGPENGVRILRWNEDVNQGPGNEARRKLLRTQDGNVFKIVGTYGGAGTLYITSNYVIPRGGPAQNASIVA